MDELKTTAYIEEFPVISDEPVRWALREGTAPAEQSFKLLPDHARALIERRKKPVTVTLVSNKGVVKAENLWIRNNIPGDHKFNMRLNIADSRCFWKNTHVLRRYNMRRHVGYRAVNRPDEFGNKPVVPRLWYREWSVAAPQTPSPRNQAANDDISIRKKSVAGPNGTFTVKLQLMDVISAANRIHKKWNPSFRPVLIFDDPKLEEKSRSLMHENIEIDDDGETAVSQVLELMPEMGLFVALDGAYVLYNKALRSEIVEVTKTKPLYVGQGHIEITDLSNMRPEHLRFGFTREIELRVDYLERTSVSDISGALNLGDELRCQNVMPVPDLEIEIEGATDDIIVGRQTVGQGTWVTIEQMIRAWIRTYGNPPGIGELDHDLLQRMGIPYNDIWPAFDIAGLSAPNVDWATRLNLLSQHYRRTYRLNQKIVDRVTSIKASRVALIDPTTGARGPSPVITDYFVLNTRRAYLAGAKTGEKPHFGWNVAGWAEKFGPDAKLAPAQVHVLDEEQGVFQVEFLNDPHRMHTMVLPSKVTGIPVGDAKKIFQRPISWDAIVPGVDPPKLSPDHKMSTILTVVPGAPNDNDQLEWVKVSPQHPRLRATLPPSALEDCFGPPMEFRVKSGLDTARIAWNDARATDIRRCLGIGNGAADTEGLVLNSGIEDPSRGASIVNLALALACQVYARLSTRMTGSGAGIMNPTVRPRGSIEEVVFEVQPDGVGKTQITLPLQSKEISMFAFMDASTRAFLLKQIRWD